ncbi:MAG TPA: 5'-nucleotidase C-terminal domain-containing protein [Myxococcaceae bacterium]|nr:5'-nucleotidase C-terminal domain-containing protein [Myxococcaceae bacterium]
MAAPARPLLRLTIAGTNDWHGWLMPHQHRARDGSMVEEGGLPLYAGALDILRTETQGRLLVVDAGDVFQGTLVSNLSEGAAMVDAFNALGMQAVAVGNHEFDYGPAGPAPVPQAPGDDPLGAFKARVAQARFPFLGENIVEASTGQHPAWLGPGTLLEDVGGVLVGIVGLATPETPRTTNPVNVAGLRFLPLAPAVRSAAGRLRAQGADLVVVVAHAGGACDDLHDPHDLSRCDRGQEIFALLEALPPGTVDAVVAGHTHRTVGHFVQGTPVIETSALGRSFGLIELALDPVTRRPLPAETRIEAEIALCERVVEGTARCDADALRSSKPLVGGTLHGQPLRQDAKLQALLAPSLAAVAELQARPLGVQVPAALHRVARGESPLGSTAADALRRMEGADIAILNPGGLRADLAAGPLTYGRLYETFPFDNAVATLQLRPADIRRLLDAFLARGRTPQQSGLRMEIAVCPGGLRLVGLALADGGPLVEGRLYRVVLPDYLARGGDGLEAFMADLPADHVDLGDRRPLNLRDALAADLQKRGEPLVAPRSGRTTLVQGGAARCPPG